MEKNDFVLSNQKLRFNFVICVTFDHFWLQLLSICWWMNNQRRVPILYSLGCSYQVSGGILSLCNIQHGISSHCSRFLQKQVGDWCRVACAFLQPTDRRSLNTRTTPSIEWIRHLLKQGMFEVDINDLWNSLYFKIAVFHRENVWRCLTEHSPLNIWVFGWTFLTSNLLWHVVLSALIWKATKTLRINLNPFRATL